MHILLVCHSNIKFKILFDSKAIRYFLFEWRQLINPLSDLIFSRLKPSYRFSSKYINFSYKEPPFKVDLFSPFNRTGTNMNGLQYMPSVNMNGSPAQSFNTGQPMYNPAMQPPQQLS